MTVCWGLDGFEYGTQVILKRNGIDEEIVERLDQESWDGTIDNRMKKSWHFILAYNDNATQTGETFIERMRVLEQELKQRNVTFPVVICVDNHISPTSP